MKLSRFAVDQSQKSDSEHWTNLIEMLLWLVDFTVKWLSVQSGWEWKTSIVSRFLILQTSIISQTGKHLQSNWACITDFRYWLNEIEKRKKYSRCWRYNIQYQIRYIFLQSIHNSLPSHLFIIKQVNSTYAGTSTKSQQTKNIKNNKIWLNLVLFVSELNSIIDCSWYFYCSVQFSGWFFLWIINDFQKRWTIENFQIYTHPVTPFQLVVICTYLFIWRKFVRKSISYTIQTVEYTKFTVNWCYHDLWMS